MEALVAHTINYSGIDLTVEGAFVQGEERTHDYPGSPDGFEVRHVYAGGTTDIIELIYDVEELEREVLKQHYN